MMIELPKSCTEMAAKKCTTKYLTPSVNAYARSVEHCGHASPDLPRLKIDTIPKIDFVDMTTTDQSKYPKNMDPKFIRKGNVTFSSGNKLDGVLLGVE